MTRAKVQAKCDQFAKFARRIRKLHAEARVFADENRTANYFPEARSILERAADIYEDEAKGLLNDYGFDE